MKPLTLRAAAELLPADSRAELVVAWLSEGVDYVLLARDPRSPRTALVKVGSAGQVGTLAKALRMTQWGVPYAYIEALSFTEARLARQLDEIASREQALAQAVGLGTGGPSEVGGALAMGKPDVDAITVGLLQFDLSQQRGGELLLTLKRELDAREEAIRLEATELAARIEYIAHVEGSLVEKLDEMNRRGAELEQLREDLDRRELMLKQVGAKPLIRLFELDR